MPEKEFHIRIGAGTRAVEEAANGTDVVIVVDVLRASSTIVTAISNRARTVMAVTTPKRAVRVSRSIRNSILAGERKGLRIGGFRLGNSPLEYTPEVVLNKNVILTTTNCTRVLDRCISLPHHIAVLVGAFLNATPVAKLARQLAVEHNREISIIQAGAGGKPCKDDLGCANLIGTLISSEADCRAKVKARNLASSALFDFLSNTRHGRNLIRLGHESDVKYCSQLDIMSAIPALCRSEGKIAKLQRYK